MPLLPASPDKKEESLGQKAAEMKPESRAPGFDLETLKAKEAAEIAQETGLPGFKEIEEAKPPSAQPPSLSVARSPKDKKLIEIEKILEKDLEDAFLHLPSDRQIKLKIEGEKTAKIIWQMIETAKIQVKKIMELIRRWLKIIPGINRFFLEQETKIKTDKILALTKNYQKEKK